MRYQLCVGLVVLAACGGTDATVNGVFPAEGFTGRSLRVEISGNGTEWSGTPRVDFGAGVTVDRVTVATSTLLFADITIAPGAALGPRDIKITGDGTFTLNQAFVLESPIELRWQGEAARGSAPYFSIVNQDVDTPFDLTQDANQKYLNLAISAPAGVTLNIESATPYGITGRAFIDVEAMPGPLTLSSGTSDHIARSSLGTDLEIELRGATMLIDGTAVLGTLPNSGDSLLYSLYTPLPPMLLRAAVTTTSSDAAPVTMILPANGRWAGALGSSAGVANGTGPYYVVVYDNGVAGGYTFSLTGHARGFDARTEGNDANNGTTAGAPTASLPFLQTGALSSAADTDMINVPLFSPGRLHVIAKGPSDATDTAIDISNGTSVIGGLHDDAERCGLSRQCGEEVVTPMLTGGTYFVSITAGAAFAVTDNEYELLIYIE